MKQKNNTMRRFAYAVLIPRAIVTFAQFSLGMVIQHFRCL